MVNLIGKSLKGKKFRRLFERKKIEFYYLRVKLSHSYSGVLDLKHVGRVINDSYV